MFTAAENPMSLELLTTLEAKIQSTLETLELLNMELEEEKQKNARLTTDKQTLVEERDHWNNKVVGLVDLLKDEPA